MLLPWEMFPLQFWTLLGTGDSNATDGRCGDPSAPWPFPSPELTIIEQSRIDTKAFCKFTQNE